MSKNEIVKTNGSTALTTEASPWREFCDEERGTNFGRFLKFRKGLWTLGEDDQEVPKGARFVAALDELHHGWVRWWGGVPTDHRLGRVVDRHRVVLREELGDQDESKWEVEPNGVRRDPWSRTFYLGMRDERNDEIVCYTTSSVGGRDAVYHLTDRFDRLRHRFKGKMPVVLLESESYQHKSYGKVLKPKFRVVDWAYWDDETAADPDGALQTQRAAEMDDDIPF
jgi:hypothetical protein